MYYFPNDDLVRTGDIIQLVDGDEYTKYLVISADCHLLSFWKKNFGNLTLVPMYEKCNENVNLKNKLKLNAGLSKYNEKSSRVTSISNSWIQESLSIVSSIPVLNDTLLEYKDYVIFPKEIITINVPPPFEVNNDNINMIRNLRLLYSHFGSKVVEEGKSRINLNEPFRTPLIQFILNNISGYGSPDYPFNLQEVIKAKKLT
ncbi:hypothetical protein [Chryseobacterium tongliaoense]|uniref:hypothetical protein n=1 Tax=Chryseobacterium tongliaoense TaxID=3240933 RepID=UPI003519B65B